MSTDHRAVDLPARLLLFLDSRSPAGAHSHSGGLEVAISQGIVGDLPSLTQYCHGRLRTTGAVSAAFAAAACHAAAGNADPHQWRRLDAEYSARTPSPATRAASRAMGAGLRRLLRATLPESEWSHFAASWALIAEPHQPLVLGAGCGLLGGSPMLAARSALLATANMAASSAIRVLGLDPYAVHAMVAGLDGTISAVARLSAEPVRADFHDGFGFEVAGMASLPCDSAPALEILADLHVREGMRLFAS